MSLPGSRPDIVRTANVPGPSPVGGAKGGTEGRAVMNLDEFEYQAAHYNVACAYACLGNVREVRLFIPFSCLDSSCLSRSSFVFEMIVRGEKTAVDWRKVSCGDLHEINER